MIKVSNYMWMQPEAIHTIHIKQSPKYSHLYNVFVNGLVAWFERPEEECSDFCNKLFLQINEAMTKP